MSKEEAIENYCFLKREDIIGENMLALEYEMMLYSHDARIGNIFTYEIHQTNAGLLRAH